MVNSPYSFLLLWNPNLGAATDSCKDFTERVVVTDIITRGKSQKPCFWKFRFGSQKKNLPKGGVETCRVHPEIWGMSTVGGFQRPFPPVCVMLWVREMQKGNAGQDCAAGLWIAAKETQPFTQGPAIDGKIVVFCHWYIAQAPLSSLPPFPVYQKAVLKLHFFLSWYFLD